MAKNKTSEVMQRHTATLKELGAVKTTFSPEHRILTIELNLEIIKYHRHRSNNRFGITYDPMGTYKKVLKNLIAESLTANGIELTDELMEAPLSVKTVYAKPPVKSGNSIKKLMTMLAGLWFRVSTPDIDNFQKTTFDVLNKLVWKDDAQIWKIESQKIYSATERTFISVIYNRQPELTTSYIEALGLEEIHGATARAIKKGEHDPYDRNF